MEKIEMARRAGKIVYDMSGGARWCWHWSEIVI
jgi:hypothetical protein